MSKNTTDEQLIERLYGALEAKDPRREDEEEACWVLLERERQREMPVVEATVTIRAFLVEVA